MTRFKKVHRYELASGNYSVEVDDAEKIDGYEFDRTILIDNGLSHDSREYVHMSEDDARALRDILIDILGED